MRHNKRGALSPVDGVPLGMHGNVAHNPARIGAMLELPRNRLVGRNTLKVCRRMGEGFGFAIAKLSSLTAQVSSEIIC